MLFVMYVINILSSGFFLLRGVRWVCMMCRCSCLLGFGIGMILASSHVCGMMLLFNYTLYMLVRYGSPIGTICLKCLMLILSGPVEFFYVFIVFPLRLEFEVTAIVVVCSLCVPYLWVCLCFVHECLLNAFIICVGEVIAFSLKLFFANPCKRVWVLCFCYQCVSKYSHIQVLWK